jgi:hypothetical protein
MIQKLICFGVGNLRTQFQDQDFNISSRKYYTKAGHFLMTHIGLESGSMPTIH